MSGEQALAVGHSVDDSIETYEGMTKTLKLGKPLEIENGK